MKLPKLAWWAWVAIAFVGAAIVSAVIAPADPTPTEAIPATVRVSDLREVFPDGHVGVVPAGSAPDLMLAKARDICGAAAICQVSLWVDAERLPRGWPMTDREMTGLVFSYTLNRNSGADDARYDCTAFPDTPPESCIAR